MKDALIVILCNYCNHENNNDAMTCVECGREMLKYNFCGVPVIGDNSIGQVLGMRYIIIELLSEDDTGCTYKAEDAEENSEVIVKTLPLSSSLNPEQVEHLKKSRKTTASLSHTGIDSYKTFDISGRVRFFVYEYSEWLAQQGRNLAERIREELSGKIALESSARIKAEAELQNYKNKLEELEAEIAKQKQENAELLTKSINQTKQLKADYEEAINLLNGKLAEQQENLAAALSEADARIKTLEDKKEDALTSIEEHKKVLDELKANTLEQEQGYISQLNQVMQKYEQIIDGLRTEAAQREEKYSEILKEFENKLENERQVRKQLEGRQTAYDDIVENLKAQIAAQDKQYTDELKQADSNFEELSAAITRANEKIKYLAEEKEKAAQQNKKHQEALENVNARAAQQQREYTKQTDRMQWKIDTISSGLEKLLLKSKKKETRVQTSPVPGFRIGIAALTLGLAIICGLGIHYFYINYPRLHKNTDKQPTTVHAPEPGINEMRVDQVLTEQENKTAELSEEETVEHKTEQTKKELFPENPLTKADSPVNEQQDEAVAKKGPEDFDKFSFLKFAKEVPVKTQEQTDSQSAENFAEGAVTPTIEQQQQEEPVNAEQEYLTAAEEGQSDAMYKLGEAYLKGAGTEKNTVKGVEWLEKAADAGDDTAMFELGLMYYAGRDVKKDLVRAMHFFTRSSQAGNALAMYNLGRIYHIGDEGIGADAAKAVQLYEEAAQAGLTEAMNQLSQMYFFGDIVQQDYAKAAHYYQLSANGGDLKGMYNLAILYLNGVGVEQNIRKAMLWFIKAARQGDPDSMYRLGVLFESGIGIEQDLEKAIYWYQTAAQNGQNEAKEHLVRLGENWSSPSTK